jgi:hypothetical protein
MILDVLDCFQEGYSTNFSCFCQVSALEGPGDWPYAFWNDVLDGIISQGSSAMNVLVLGAEFGTASTNLAKRGVKVVSCLTRRHDMWGGQKEEKLESTDMKETFAKMLKAKVAKATSSTS